MPIGARWWTQLGNTNIWSARSIRQRADSVPWCNAAFEASTVWRRRRRSCFMCGSERCGFQRSRTRLASLRIAISGTTRRTGILYVYSAGGNPAGYSAYAYTVAPIVLSGGSLLNLNAVSWLEIQHLQMDWFDGYGVQVQGASDHLWLANIAADSEVENGATPLGFFGASDRHAGGRPSLQHRRPHELCGISL